MTIKHLVISGGGPSGLKSIGVLYKLNLENYWKLSDIESIYATSVGTIIAVFLSVCDNWDDLLKYIIERPWHNTIQISPLMLYEIYNKKGLFDKSFILTIFKPLFASKNIPINITLNDFYNITKIDHHFYTFELNASETIDISYKTHPDFQVLDVLLMSCAIPLIISPVCISINGIDKCYIDGGAFDNYPLKYCIESGNNTDEILGIKYICDDTHLMMPNITESSTIYDMFLTVTMKIIKHISTETKQPKIKNEVNCLTKHMTIETLNLAITSQELRQNWINDGINVAIAFINKKY